MPAFAAELRAVRDAFGARRGLGVSLGAGALLAAAVLRPADFERLVLVHACGDRPTSTGRAVERVDAMAVGRRGRRRRRTDDVAARRAADGVRDRRVVRLWARQQAERMVRASLARVMREMPQLSPVATRPQLAAVGLPGAGARPGGRRGAPRELADELVGRCPTRPARSTRPVACCGRTAPSCAPSSRPSSTTPQPAREAEWRHESSRRTR